MHQTHTLNNVNTIVSATSSACDEITISLWVYRSPVPAAPAAKPTKSNDEVVTLKMIIAMGIQVLMVIATIAFVHQNLYYVVSKCTFEAKTQMTHI